MKIKMLLLAMICSVVFLAGCKTSSGHSGHSGQSFWDHIMAADEWVQENVW